MRTILSFIGAACDPSPRFRPLYSCVPPRLHGPTAASSSSPTRRMARASTNASPRAKNAARMPPGPIASRGISPRPRPTGASSPMKSPARFPRRLRAASMPVAANTLPLPAGANRLPRQDCGDVRPYRRPGNDVTLPREAGMGGRVGCALRLSVAGAKIALMAGYA
jgi:hypothetical protein